MSTIQKAFVFIVLVVALLTAAVSLVLFAQRTNWKATTDSTQKELSDAKAKFNTAEKESAKALSDAKSDALNLQTQVASKDNSLKEAQSALENTRAEKTSLESLMSELKAKMEIVGQNMDAMQARMAELDQAKQAAEAKLEEEKAARQQAEETLAIANRKNKDFTAKVDSLTEQLTGRDDEIKNLKQRIDVMNAVAPGIGENVTAPSGQHVYGTVTGMSKDGTTLYTSIGTDDGVKEGMTLLVYKSDGTYVAVAKVYDVAAKKSAARVVPPVVGTVVEGDNVTNK